MSQRNVMRRYALTFIIMMFCISGCVVLPLSADRSAPALVGQKLEQKELEFISARVTTRDEVTTRLGEPPIELEGFKILAYPWIELEKNWVIAGGGPGGVGGISIPETMDRTLFVAIDNRGRVLKYGLDQKQRSDKLSIVAQARRWAESNGVPVPPMQSGFSAPVIAPGQAVIVLYRMKPAISMIGYLSRSRFPESVGVAIDEHYCAELIDGEYMMIPVLPGTHHILVHPAPPYRFWPGHPGWKTFSDIKSSTTTLEVSANKIYFIEAKVTLEIGLKIVTSLAIRDESEAKPTLTKAMAIW